MGRTVEARSRHGILASAGTRNAEMIVLSRSAGDAIAKIVSIDAGCLQSQLVALISLAIRFRLMTVNLPHGLLIIEECPVRAAALKLLAARQSAETATIIDAALSSDMDLLRAEARDLLLKREPERAQELLIEIAQSSTASMLERQRAVNSLRLCKTNRPTRFC